MADEISDADAIEAWRAADPEGYQAVVDEAKMLERRRCQTIVESPEAEGREALALHLATETDFAAEEAIAILRTSPAAATATLTGGGNRLDRFLASRARNH